MRPALALMIPNAPRYVSPKEHAENRARWLRFAYWLAVVIPAAIALMIFGYSDQAPRWLREFTVSLDGTSGFPVLGLIKAIAAP
jgi:hypothetical protein